MQDDGSPKIVPRCTLPLTALGAVEMIITDLVVFRFAEGHLRLVELMPSTTLDEVRAKTGVVFFTTYGLGSHTHTSSDIRFNESWTTNSIGEGGKQTAAYPNMARMTASGESVSVVLNGGPDQGKVYLSLDGGLITSALDLYSPVQQRLGFTFYLSEFKPFSYPVNEHIHNISIYPANGLKKTSSSGYNVTLHAIDVGYNSVGMFSDVSGATRKKALTYSVSGSTATISATIAAATAWDAATNLSLTKVSSGGDIQISEGNALGAVALGVPVTSAGLNADVDSKPYLILYVSY